MKKFILVMFIVGCAASPTPVYQAAEPRRPRNCDEMEGEYRILNFLCNDDSVNTSRREEICRAAIDMDRACEYGLP